MNRFLFFLGTMIFACYAQSWEVEKQFKSLSVELRTIQAKLNVFSQSTKYLKEQNAEKNSVLWRGFLQKIEELNQRQTKNVALLKTFQENVVLSASHEDKTREHFLEILNEQKLQQEAFIQLKKRIETPSKTFSLDSGFYEEVFFLLSQMIKRQEQSARRLESIYEVFRFDPFTQGEGESKISFLPSLHGFAFVNYFSGYPIPSLPFLETLLKKYSSGNDAYGLCGGMSSAAYDFYLAEKTIPIQTNPPEKGTSLYQYVFRRQSDTFGQRAEYIFRFIEWMALAEKTLEERTLEEFKGILETIKQGEGVVLGLVYVKASETLVLWKNHQVLAYGYKRVDARTFHLFIYDPNYPKDDQVWIEVSQTDAHPIHGVSCRQWIRGKYRKRVHGFFRMPYRPENPENL